MTGWPRQIGAGLAALALALASAEPVPAQNSPQVSSTPQAGYVLKMNGELVLTNVVARDSKTGEVVRGLTRNDFSVFENGKPQRIETFDFESVEMATPLKEATVSGLAEGGEEVLPSRFRAGAAGVEHEAHGYVELAHGVFGALQVAAHPVEAVGNAG